MSQAPDRYSVLVVDDSADYRALLGSALRSSFDVRGADSRKEALKLLRPAPDAALIDLRLTPGSDEKDGLDLLEEIARLNPSLPVLMITAYGDLETAIEAMRLGAVDFLSKEASPGEIKARLNQALQRGRLSNRVDQLERDLRLVESASMVGASEAVEEIRRVAELLGRDGDATVLIRGETGTGKELVARAIHAHGRRAHRPFVPVMLNALPDSMIETELFGNEAGAYTDAPQRRTGYLDRADGGVLFLDEIGELDAGIQVKLLRLLESREFMRLGSSEPIRLDVQVVAATNADLEAKVQEGKFRADLYYRLNVHQIVVPPLRKRPQDVPLLIDHFLNLYKAQGKRPRSLSADALTLLTSFSWPGNIRQLKNAIESALVRAELAGHAEVRVEDLPKEMEGQKRAPDLPSDFSIDRELARIEFAFQEQALGATDGKKGEAWRLLGYNDRFAMIRRRKRLLEQYPELVGDYLPPSDDVAFSS